MALAVPTQSSLNSFSTGPLRGIPPLRVSPYKPDDFDAQRVAYNRRLWCSQDYLLKGRDRQVEENIRMLCGQHYTVYSELAGRFVDLRQYLADDERRWRQFPVTNRLLLWFMILHARMTENPPVITFQPSTGDRIDAELAEVMDAVFKHIWHDAGMLEVIDHLTSWLIPGGSAYLKSRIDLNRGDFLEFSGPATLSLLDAEGNSIFGPDGQPIARQVGSAPYGPSGEPLAAIYAETGEVVPWGEPHTMREGGIVVDVLSPLEVRGEWGANIPWHQKSWHMHRTFLTPEQVYNIYGVEMEPEITGAAATEVGELQRLMFGAGFFGAAGGKHDVVTAAKEADKEGYIEVFEGWYKPCAYPGMEETPDSPGGRLLVTTRTRVLQDGRRFARFKYTSPIRRFDFVRVPGRPQGTSPQEMLNGPIRTRNRLMGLILDHTSKNANPVRLIDKNSGIPEGTNTSKPGAELYGNFPATSQPLRFVAPPPLSADVYRAHQMLTVEHDELGNLPGSMGSPPTSDASGELVKELRYNSDRFVGPTQRRTVIELARMAEDWIAMLPIIWDQEKIITVAGDDMIATTITVMPYMFEQGNVHVVPDVESMLPEGRGERQTRAWRMYEAGVFGQPGTPEAVNAMLELANYPHLSRAVRPGGVDRSMAEQNLGKLLQGTPADEIPVFEWYDFAVHLSVVERFMKSPQYLKVSVYIQQQVVAHRQMLRMAQFAKVQQDLALQNAIQMMAMAAAAQQSQAMSGGASSVPANEAPTAQEAPSVPTATGDVDR